MVSGEYKVVLPYQNTIVILGEMRVVSRVIMSFYKCESMHNKRSFVSYIDANTRH